MKHDDAGTVAQMVVLRVAAGEATMGQKNTVVHQWIVVIVVVTTEDSHHITTFLDSRKHATVEVRSVGFLHSCTVKNHLCVSNGSVIFRQWIVHEHQSRHRFASILAFECRWPVAIKVYLFRRKPLITAYTCHFTVVMGIHTIEHGSSLCAITRLDGQCIVKCVSIAFRLYTVAVLLCLVVQLIDRYALFRVMIAQQITERHFQIRQHIEHLLQAHVARFGINDVACQHNKVGLFGLHNLIKAIRGLTRCRISEFIM